MNRGCAAARPERASRWRADLAWVAAVTVGSFLVGSLFELRESLALRLTHFERWQLDEMPLSLTVLACGLAWYAMRRRRELEAQLALRAQAEARSADLLAHNRELAQRLISLQEGERLALARELHDELGQTCTAIRIETAFLRHCAADDRAALLGAAERADTAAKSLQQLVNSLLRRLRPANLDTLGLAAALQELCESWQRRTGVGCTFRHEGLATGFGDSVDIALYRIAQEALTNVARHARARNVQVTLAQASAAEVSLRVQDDGQGMDTSVATRGLGLLGAFERAAAVGGDLELGSAPGQGLALVARIPLPPAGSGGASPDEGA